MPQLTQTLYLRYNPGIYLLTLKISPQSARIGKSFPDITVLYVC